MVGAYFYWVLGHEVIIHLWFDVNNSLLRRLFVPPPSGEFIKLHSASLHEILVIYDSLFLGTEKSNQTVNILHVSQYELFTYVDCRSQINARDPDSH